MSVAFVEYTLPDSPYEMWARGELEEWLGVPDGFRVEIIEGDIVVSPAASFGHNRIAARIAAAFVRATDANRDFGWEAIPVTGVGEPAERGWIPDVSIVDRERADEVSEAGISIARPGDIAMAIEVTSPSNADHDREPGPQHRQKNGNRIKSKWTDFARAGVPYYLLVDCDPRVSRATLYSAPNQSTGRYETAVAWEFGEMIELPTPFDVAIDTADWKTWS